MCIFHERENLETHNREHAWHKIQNKPGKYTKEYASISPETPRSGQTGENLRLLISVTILPLSTSSLRQWFQIPGSLRKR
jgi:hypothetical protein